MNPSIDLVYIDDYGLLGSNFYWHKYANHGQYCFDKQKPPQTKAQRLLYTAVNFRR